MMGLLDKVFENFGKVFSSWDSFISAVIGVIMFIAVIKPMFQVSVISGILLILTFLYILLIKTEIVIESPGYAIVLFVIFAVRTHILPIFFDGLKSIRAGLWMTGFTFVVVWFMIYVKTKELEEH